MQNYMILNIENFIQDMLKYIKLNEHRPSGSADPYTIGHYAGIIAGKKEAYNAVLYEIKHLRRK